MARSPRLLCLSASLGNITGVGCHAFLQGIFPAQGLSLHLLRLLHQQVPLENLVNRGMKRVKPSTGKRLMSLADPIITEQKVTFLRHRPSPRFVWGQTDPCGNHDQSNRTLAGQGQALHKAGNKWGFPGGSVGKESVCSAGDPGLIAGSGRSPGEGIAYPLVKNPPAMQETWVPSLGWEDPLEKGKAAHSSILAWRIPGTVQSMGSQRAGHTWVTFPFRKQIINVTFFFFTR